MMKIGTKAQ